MSRYGTRRADTVHEVLRRREGVALVATILILLILSAIGLGLSLTTSLEPAASANYECAWRVRYGAESGVAAAAHDLTAADLWDDALAGRSPLGHLTAVPAEIVMPDGRRLALSTLTNLANCGAESACSDAALTAFTADRPWGPNNPRWQPVGMLRVEELEPGQPGAAAVVVIVWVGDDPAELDGNPLRDTEPAASGAGTPGACVVSIRAEAFSIRAAHRTVTATVARSGPGCWPGPRIVSWRTTP